MQVRIAACAALVEFVRSAGSSYCATNSGYLAAGVVLHMDDGDQQVAEAACQVRNCKLGRFCFECVTFVLYMAAGQRQCTALQLGGRCRLCNAWSTVELAAALLPAPEVCLYHGH
jgi:hypothetical protein